MENKNAFKKYHARLVIEGMIKALICGLIMGFAAGIIPATIILLANLSKLWVPISIAVALSLTVGFSVAAIATVVFYFFKFRPTTKQIARRIDRLGFDERFITMKELENDSSYIAMRQREDAKIRLSENNKKLKLSIFIAPVVVAAILAVTSVFTLIGADFSFSSVKAWRDPSKTEFSEGDLISVNYVTQGNGFILGDTDQLVLFGDDATTVVAVADEGWAFAAWINAITGEQDSVEIPERTDKQIRDTVAFVAVFQEVSGDGEGEGEGEPSEGDPGDKPSESQPQDGSGQKNDGEDPFDDPGTGAGGQYDEINWIIDGETYYGTMYQQMLDNALQIMANGGDLTPFQIGLINAYLKGIVPKV